MQYLSAYALITITSNTPWTNKTLKHTKGGMIGVVTKH